MVWRDLHDCADVTKAVHELKGNLEFWLERFQRCRLRDSAGHRGALVAEACDVRDHEDRTFSPYARARRAAMRGHAQPVPVVVVLGLGELPPMNPQLEPGDLKVG